MLRSLRFVLRVFRCILKHNYYIDVYFLHALLLHEIDLIFLPSKFIFQTKVTYL